MADIKIYGKFQSATSSGKLLDYSAIENTPNVVDKPNTLPQEDSVLVMDKEGKTSYKKVSELSGGSGSSIVSAELVPVD